MESDSVSSSNNRGHKYQSPPPTERAIFREEARQQFIHNAEKVELPRVVSPRYFFYLWIISLALMALGLLVAFWPLIRQW